MATQKAYRPTNKERAVIEMVSDRLEKMKRKRQDQEEHWNNADKQYQMYRTNRPKDEWRADLKLPDTFSVVETALAEMVDQSPGIVYRPRESGDVERANKLQKIFEYTWEKGNGDIELLRFMKDCLLYGTAIGEEYWRQDLVEHKDMDDFDLEEFEPKSWKKREKIEFDDCYFESLSVWSFFVDPMADDLDSARDCAKVLTITKDDFEKKYKRYSNAKKVVQGTAVYKQEWFKPLGNMEDDEIEVIHYYDKTNDLYLVIANGVLLTKTENPIPYKHKDFPFVRAIDIMLPHSFYGLGEARVMKHLQDERDTIRNMRLDTVHLNIQKQYIVDDRLEMDDEDLIARPHGIIRGPKDSIEVVPQAAIHPEAYREEELINDDIIKATGIDIRMQSLGGRGDTATEVAILKESSLKRIRLKLRVLEKTALYRLGRLRLANIQQFYSIPVIKKVLGGEGVEEVETFRNVGFKHPKGTYEWFTARPNDITGEYDVVIIAGATLPVSKALEAQKRINLFDRLMGHPDVDQRKLAEALIESHDIDPDELMTKQQAAPPQPGLGPEGAAGGMPTPEPPVGVGRSPAKPTISPEQALPGRAMAGG